MEDETNDDEIITSHVDVYRKYEEMAQRGFFGTGQAN
jgi:hypothetical protein